MQASMATGATQTGDRAHVWVTNRVSRSGRPYAGDGGGSGGTQGASGSVTLLMPQRYPDAASVSRVRSGRCTRRTVVVTRRTAARRDGRPAPTAAEPARVG